MTKREGAIVGAYTGFLCGAFEDLHRYVEELMGRPVWTHEMGDPKVAEEIKKRARPEFVAMAKACTDKEKTQ